MKIVVNRCHGGFGLSPAALLRLYELGCQSVAVPVTTYYGSVDMAQSALAAWRTRTGTDKDSWLMNAFSTDESNVLTDNNVKRDDPLLIRVIEELGDKASGMLSELEIVDIPDGVDWQIEEYDGSEWVAEAHRTW